MEREALLRRARERGVNPIVYWIARGLLQPFFHLYFRMSRIGREHIPAEGPVILAANHRSFLDPFVIGCMVRRPCYFVAKKELFGNRLTAWILNSLGAFPIDRGNADGDAMGTARAILERGDCVVIFPEGTRIRPGGLGRPKRGVGRLALETGAPVVPIAVTGTEDIRRGWRIRPHKVRLRAGRPLRFPQVESPSPKLAGAVTERIWPMVALQWEWLGGLPPIRRVAVIGAGDAGRRIAGALGESAGVQVATGPAADLDLHDADLVVVDAPARSLPAILAVHGPRIGAGAAVLVVSRGLVAPLGTLPGAFVAETCPGIRGVACLAGPGLVAGDGPLVVASADRALAAQVGQLLERAGFAAQRTDDVVGTELAALAAGVASSTHDADVFGEVDALARRMGARPETLTGPAGAGTLTTREAETDELDAVPLLAFAMREHGVPGHATEALSARVEGGAERAA